MNGAQQSGPETPSVDEQAAQWIARLDRGDLTAAERKAFDKWATANPDNMQAVQSLSSLWGDMNQFTQYYQPVKKEAAISYTSSWPKAAALAATFLVALIGVSYFGYGPDFTDNSMEFATEIGDYERAGLVDGSSIELNTGTHIETHYSQKKRSVILLSGEALFDVAKDKDRPFVVAAGGSLIEAVGTRFNIQMHKNRVEVIVTEGTVKISRGAGDQRGHSDGHAVYARAGEIANISKDGHTDVAPITDDEWKRLLSWRDGMLSYEGETLAEVVADFGRYNDLEFIIADKGAGRVRIGGYFKKNDVAGFLEALEAGFSIRAESLDGNKVILRASN